MKERLLTLALAAGAFVLFYAFFVPKPSPNGGTLELPSSIGKGDDGYQAVWRWLEAQKIPVMALHEPYTRLSAVQPTAARGNVLITTLPHRLAARKDEFNELDAWISRGNTLLVLAALDDTPRWAVGADASLLHTLGRMTRINFEVIGAPGQKKAPGRGPFRAQEAVEAMRQFIEPQRVVITAKGAHPLFDGVRSVLAVSEFPAAHWRATSMDASPVLDIGERPATVAPGSEPAIWLKRQWDGQILVCGFASPFSNRLIAEQDNARLLSNIIAWSRGPQGAVIFDDDHQGFVSYYDAKAFFADPRLHRTLSWIVLLWLLFVLGWQRMRASSDGWNPIDVTTFIGVTGGFFAGALSPATAGGRLFTNFFNGIRRSLNLSEDGTPVWQWLAGDARVRPAQLAELQQLFARTQEGKRVDLVHLHNLLSRLTGTFE